MSEPIYDRIAVIGCGLIGGSILRAAREYGLAREIVATDASAWVRARAAELGLADRIEATTAQAAEGADLVVFATPVAAIGEAASEAASALKPGATVTDVGSCKQTVGDALLAAIPAGVHVVPGHPIAGTEFSGPDAGFAELFQGRWTILTPFPDQGGDYEAAAERLAGFWRAMGAQVDTMDARHHDRVLAVTSHLPHLIAYTIVGSAADLEAVSEAEVMKYSAGGFRDFTRIAASDPVMWRDIFLMNRDAVLEILGAFTEDLHRLSRAIRHGEGDILQEAFTRTRAIRRGVIALGQESPVPNFGRDAKTGAGA